MSTFAQSFALLLPALLVWAASGDFLTRIIPNALAVALAAAFIAMALGTGWPPALILSHASCAAIMLAAGFALFGGGVIGGGDAKLFAAAALWFGWEWIAPLAVATSLFGGILAVVYLTVPRLANAGRPASLPYGVAIAAAGLYLFPEWMLWASRAGL